MSLASTLKSFEAGGTGFESVADDRMYDVEQLRKAQKKLERVKGRTRVNPKINLRRQENIQRRIDSLEAQLRGGAYLDEINEILGG